jgi:glycosyltransferase involved in cell wall biosynthesis
MKILMISPFDLVVERLWGPTTRLHNLAREIIAAGHEVVLAGPPPFDRMMPAFLDGVPLHYFRTAFYRYSYPDDGRQSERKKTNSVARLPLVMFSRWLEVVRLIWRKRIDVLYLNRAYVETGYPAFMAHLITRVPMVFDWDDLEGMHGFSTMFRQRLGIQLFETVNETCFPRLSGATVVASRYLRQFAVNIGVPEEAVHYAPTVADAAAFHPALNGAGVRERYKLKHKKVLLYVGSLEEGNGVNLEAMLHTMKLLLQTDPSFVLLVVGDGDLLHSQGKKGRLALLADEMGLTDSIVFAGGVPYREVPSYIAAADACLALFPINMVTLTKSPLKVYEYMASGKAVIGRNIGEMSHCVTHGETGILMNSDDPREYAEAIVACFAREGYLQELGVNARRKIVEEYSWSRSAEIVIKACEGVVSTRRRPPTKVSS